MKGKAGRYMSIAKGAIRLSTAKMRTSSAWRSRAWWAGSDIAGILSGGTRFPMPVYCRADHTFYIGRRGAPAELPLGLGRGGEKLRRIAFPTGAFDDGDGFPRQLADCGQHVP